MTTTPDLRKDFSFFLANQHQLVEEYNGKFVVIHDQKVVGAYSSALEALTEAQKTMQVGTFLVQKVEPGTDSYTQTFHSRVLFS